MLYKVSTSNVGIFGSVTVYDQTHSSIRLSGEQELCNKQKFFKHTISHSLWSGYKNFKTKTRLCLMQHTMRLNSVEMKVLLLTTSSRAALRPNEQVRSVRQLMKEVKRSLGSAVNVLRGNMVMRLEMILEMPTASESSISILGMQITEWDLKIRPEWFLT